MRLMAPDGSACLSFLSFVLLFLTKCNALRGKPAAISATVYHASPSSDFNGTPLVKYEYPEAEIELARGVKLIENMKTESSCKTKATQQLLSSCSEFDGSQTSYGRKTAGELEKVKSQYAARLAVCELQEASKPPRLPRCSTLGTSASLGAVDRVQLAACLSELQNNMIFWASYVNNLQNVGYMCQVARAEIEKEELVEQRRASLQTTLLVTKALADFQQNVAHQNAELLSHADKVRAMHNQNVEELATVRRDTSRALLDMKDEFGARMQDMAGWADNVLQRMTASAGVKNDELVTYAEKVQHGLQNIWQKIAEGNAELAARQLDDTNQIHEMAVLVQDRLQGIFTDDLSSLNAGLSSFSSDLALAGDQVTSLLGGHLSLAEGLESSFMRSRQVAETLEQINVPILDLLAKAASIANLIFSHECLVLCGFLLPLGLLVLAAFIFRFRLAFWLLRMSALLWISYASLKGSSLVSSSPALRTILSGTCQAIVISLCFAAASGLVYLCRRAIQRIPSRPKQLERLPQPNLKIAKLDRKATFELDNEASQMKRARKRSIENAARSRFTRASTSPPC